VERARGPGQRVVALEGLAAEATADRHGLGQLVVGAGEHDQLLPARELARRVVKAIVEAAAELELELGDRRGLERARKLERSDHGLFGALDPQALTATDAREPGEQPILDRRADADR